MIGQKEKTWEKSKKRISNLLQTGVIRWINKNVLSASETQNEESVLLDDSQAATQADNNTASLGVNSPELSASKGTENSETNKETEQKFNKGERFLLGGAESNPNGNVDDNKAGEKKVSKQRVGGSTLSKEADATEMMMRDALIETIEGAGIDVVTDVAIGQQVLDDANGEARLQKRLNYLRRLEEFIAESLTGRRAGQRMDIELPANTLRMVYNAIGRDFDSHSIYANGIVHSKKEHGIGGKKIDTNSIPLRDEDFALAPYIMAAPDNVVRGSVSTDGRVSVRFEKRLQNGDIIVVEKEQKNSPYDMETITMWADLSSRGADARSSKRPLHTTSESVISSIDAAKIRKDAEIEYGTTKKHTRCVYIMAAVLTLMFSAIRTWAKEKALKKLALAAMATAIAK